MATLIVQDLNHVGLSPSFVAVAAGGDQFPNDGHTFIYVKNVNIATRDVTIDSQSLCNQGVDHNIIVTVPVTTGEKLIGPFPPTRFNDPSANVQITYESEVDVTIAIIRLEPNPA